MRTYDTEDEDEEQISPTSTAESGAEEQPRRRRSAAASAERKERKDDMAPKDDDTPRFITPREAYFATLNAWVKNANISQNAMAMFPYYLMANYPQLFPPPTASSGASTTSSPPLSPLSATANGPATPNNGDNANQPDAPEAAPAPAGVLGARGNYFNFRNPILDEQAQADLINRNGGVDHSIAPFGKRAIAEVIDILILLLIKVILSFTIMTIFDLDLGIDLDKEVIRKAMDEDGYTGFLATTMNFLAFSSNLLVLEVLTKIFACLYEAIWTTLYNGATPGKMLLNIRILYVEAVVPLWQPVMPPQMVLQAHRIQMRALVFPGQTPSFKRSLMRALAKNLIMTILFPMCFVMLFFKNNRTAYDIITKTIVVEANRNGTPRPRQRQR